MSLGSRLLTLVQISDLHFADVDATTGDPIQDRAAIQLWSNSAIYDGALGHHRRGLQHLSDFFGNLNNQGEEPRLLVTGDVTAFGHGNQFDRADDFLVSQVDMNPPLGNFVGLHVRDWRSFAIPGNHDHFPGSAIMLGHSTPALNTYFPDQPFVRDPIDIGNERKLIIAGINSDADVAPHGKNRLLARGSFRSQLNQLHNMLASDADNELRVLMVHHSWHHTGFLLRMDKVSRQALAAFLHQERFLAILTGHTHQALTQIFQVSPQPDLHEVLESRCGTTTQIDSIPFNWRTIFHNRPTRSLEKNTLVLHRLYDTGEAIKWHAVGYVRTRSGFRPIGQLAKSPNVRWTLRYDPPATHSRATQTISGRG